MNWTCRGCKKTIVGYKPEHCPECHETFGGTYTGDLHRVGQHGVAVGPNRRRCLTSAELEAKGLVQNSRGYWIRRAEIPDSLRS